MEVSKSLQQLTTLAEQLETSENEITELTIQNTDLLAETGHEVDLTIELPFPVGADQRTGVSLTATDATVTDAGTLSVKLTARIADSSDGRTRESTNDSTGSKINEDTNSAVSEVTDGGTTVAASESVVASLDEDTDSSRRPIRSTSEPNVTHEASDGSSTDEGETDDPNRPAYKDPERLAEVYDPDRTFAEMTEDLGVDVTPKTVRHYMVEYGIHDSDSFSSSDGNGGRSDRPAYKDPERLAEVYDPGRTFAEMTEDLCVDVTPQTVRNHMVQHGIHDSDAKAESASGADGGSFLGKTEDEDPGEDEIAAEIAAEVELPDDLALSDVTEAVGTAKTLYEVQRELDINRDQTHHVLSELNLLELVHGRLSTVSTGSKSKEEIEHRIREAVMNGATTE